jgi:hypothetical protein
MGTACNVSAFPTNFTVLNGVLKLTNEVTLGEFWFIGATVSSWDCRASHRSRQLLNRCTDRGRTCPIAAKVASSNCFFELIQTQISYQFSQSRVLATRSPWRWTEPIK